MMAHGQGNKAAIGYLGPQGSHSHQAARRLALQMEREDETAFALTPYPSLAALMAAAELGEEIAWALLPIENILEGSVVEVLETLGLRKRQILPCAELRVPVLHHLIARPGTRLHDIRTVASHPQALGQCRGTLLNLLGPDVRFHATDSTSEAVRMLKESSVGEMSDWAAIAGPMAAKLYDMAVLQAGVSDTGDNVTRFFLVRPGGAASRCAELPPLGAVQGWKTSFCLAFPSRPGSLVEVLLIFKEAGVNLTKIESRPSRRQLGEYLFYLDAEGDLRQPEYAAVLSQLEVLTTYMHIIGAYPCLGLLENGEQVG